MTSEEMADKYMQRAEVSVVNGGCPQNIYKFNTENFRPISGHDPEWYEVFHSWRDILWSRGWKDYWYDKKRGESDFMNYLYIYKKELDLPPLEYSIDDAWRKLSNFNQYTCSQLG